MVLVALACLSGMVRGQVAVRGQVRDAITRQALPFATVSVANDRGAVADWQGVFTLDTEAGDSICIVRSIGYEADTLPLAGWPTDSLRQIFLQPRAMVLEQIVVTAGRYAQKAEESTVTIESLGASRMQNRPAVSAEEMVARVPGLHITDGQASIRGGSGFSYGAGSRVMVLVDGLPSISGDAGDVKWNFLPLETLSQVEVIKGASSAMYGSSALNGVIHLRTMEAADTPLTSVSVLTGRYGDPVRRDSTGSRLGADGKINKTLKWWTGANPLFMDAMALHSRRWKKVDVVVSGRAFRDEGYREGEKEERIRLSTGMRYRFGKDNHWMVALKTHTMWVDGSLFLLWANADSGAWRPSGGTDTATTSLNFFTGSRIAIDPSLVYFAPNGDKHTLQSRFYRIVNHAQNNQGSESILLFHEYQYQKAFGKGWKLSAGAVVSTQTIRAELYGDHRGLNLASYGQLDRKAGRWNFSLGLRAEHYRTDSVATRSVISLPSGLILTKDKPLVSDSLVLARRASVKPVLRLGANYRLAKASFVRASLGGGYRFPSVAEKFIATSVGGLRIFPNPSLQPETGWSAECGWRQLFAWRTWQGFADVALYWTEYQQMMEFTFGQYYPDSVTNPDITQYLAYSGFRSENIGNTRISGVEVNTHVRGTLGPVPVILWAGYTLANARSLDRDSAYLAGLSDPESDLLKYRFRHLFKGETTFQWRKFSWNSQVVFHSFIENVDKSFEEPLLGTIASTKLLPGLKEYRDRNQEGVWVWDMNMAWNFTENWTAIAGVRNLFNKEYMERPGDIQPPRTVVLQLKCSF